MDEPSALLALLARHQEGMVGAAVLSLFFAVCYAVRKKLAIGDALQACGFGALFAAASWLFLAEYLHLGLFFIVPVGIGGGFGAFPLVNAYTRRDERLADKGLDFITRKGGVE